MAKAKAIDKDVEEIKKLLKDGKIIMGTDTVIKALRAGRAQKVFVAENCNESTLNDIEHYSKLSKATVVRLRYPNDELGVICKKPFSISILAESR